MPRPEPYWITEEFCRENGHKGPSVLERQFPDCRSWGQRRSDMRRAFPDLVPFLDRQGRPIGHTSVPPDPRDPGPDRDEAEVISRLLPEDEMIAQLKRGATIIELANYFDCAPSRVEVTVAHMRAKHLLVTETAEGFILANEVQPVEEPYRIDTSQFGEEEFCYGAVADGHTGSKYERQDVMEDLADRFVAAGASRVLYAGNWIDGSGRKFNQHDIYVAGVDDQVGNFIEKLPQRPGLEWDVLSGDDHEGWFVQDCHVNIGHVLEDEALHAGRTDIHDLGYMERDIELAQPYGSAKLRVAHMGGGSAYALSYSMQKYVESLQGGEKPKIVVGGHYHKFDYNYAREVHLLQPGCAQDQTPFMRKKKLQAMVGGCLLWIRQNELGVVTSVKVQWMPYYDREFYAYKWKRPA